MKRVRITVPASTSNIGPGFDVMGLALSLHLTVQVEFTPTTTTTDSQTVDAAVEDTLTSWHIHYTGDSADTVPLDARRNLITRTCGQVAARHGVAGALPRAVQLTVHNPIPLGRGLGSSGAAIAAGVLLASVLTGLTLDVHQQLQECLLVENHPDNVTAALAGGWVACWTDAERDQSGFLPLPLHASVRAVTVSPHFEVKTEDARRVLPQQYALTDVVFNLQRIAQLVAALGAPQLNAEHVHRAMQDRVHQPFRQQLIPGMEELLAKLTPSTHPGLLGVCISGSGPTVLALITDGAAADTIGAEIQAVFTARAITSDLRILDVERRGAFYEEV